MGYYTNHTLEIVTGDDYVTDYKNEISRVSGYSNLFNNNHTWYDREKRMRKYSTGHPNTLFKVIGWGEDNDDMWHEYYQNGLMQRVNARIVFAPFDELELT
jgi:hypothetical protein